jgi:hypothetical protein
MVNIERSVLIGTPTSDVRGASTHQLAPTGRGPESPDSCALRVHRPMRIRLDRAISKADTGTFRNQLVKLSPQHSKRKRWRDDRDLMKFLDGL